MHLMTQFVMQKKPIISHYDTQHINMVLQVMFDIAE